TRAFPCAQIHDRFRRCVRANSAARNEKAASPIAINAGVSRPAVAPVKANVIMRLNFESRANRAKYSAFRCCSQALKMARSATAVERCNVSQRVVRLPGRSNKQKHANKTTSRNVEENFHEQHADL